jgi:hypothetical protein
MNLVQRNPIFFHLVEEIGNMARMSRIDEHGHLSSNQIRVAIVLIRVLP